jgi:cobalt/nickel transport system permease protein
MHIPDGFLSPSVAGAAAVLGVSGVVTAAVRAKRRIGPRTVALLGVTSAFVFAAEMVNFPVAFGTSGHLIGGVLAAVMVGPDAAVVVMTSVLVLQCLVYADGGLLALGANTLNMAILHPIVGYLVYRLTLGRAAHPTVPRRLAAAALGAWVATLAAAGACSGELALSGVVTPGLVFPAMLGIHALIGLGEALITALVLRAVLRIRPRSLDFDAHGATRMHDTSWGLGLVAALGLALFASPFACRWPDGLEHVAEQVGLRATPLEPSPSPLHGYALAGLHGPVSVSLAAAIGTALMFAVCWGIGLWLAPVRRSE